jgi:hypothetical protein
MLSFENKFIVLKRADVDAALEGQEKKIFWNLIDRVSRVRKNNGKKDNKYLIVNIDEPYAIDVAMIMGKHGHCNKSDHVGQDTDFIELEEINGWVGDTEINASFGEELQTALEDVTNTNFTELPGSSDVVGNPNQSKEEFIDECLSKNFVCNCAKRKLREKEGE